MGRAADVERKMRQIVALHRAGQAVEDPVGLARVVRVRRQLEHEVGIGVPKRRAAALLGVSVPALDKWVGAGRLPVVRRPGSTREEIETEALVDLTAETMTLREQGLSHAVLATAFRRLDQDGKPRRRLRPNESPQELRSNYLRTTPLDRLREAAELSYVATTLAARGRQGT
jgi:hypothetical protein